ncbi:amidase [Brachybacterium sp. DNPG3]
MTGAPLGALELADAFRRGDVDVREHTETVLAGARTVGARVGAFAHVLEERSRRQAETAAMRIAAARRAGADALADLADAAPLLGVPLPIKDLARVEGEPFEGGSAVMAGYRAEATDGVAERILEAGTVTIGKTSTPEFGMPCYTEPATGAPARTPWDPRRTAGGSSGGAGAALAAGIVPLAHGGDGGGSIRIPAACCGVVGLKPSRGVVSTGPLVTEGLGLAVEGMLARSVRDAAAGLDLIAGPRAGDFHAAPVHHGSYLADCDGAVRPLRIGVLTEPIAAEADIHPAALRGLERAVALLEGLGHETVRIPAPFGAEQWRAFMPLWSVGAATIPVPPEAESTLMPLTRWLRARGREFSAVDLAEAFGAVQQLVRSTAAAFAGLDAVITPSLSGPPAFPADLQLEDPAADFDAQCAFTPWTSTWNMTGSPALSLPLHREEIDGTLLPFGVQLGGVRIGDEPLLLALAAQLEAADPWPLVPTSAA